MGEERRAEPGYYEVYFTRTGETDGLLDNHWTEEQVHQLRETELDEHARTLDGLLGERGADPDAAQPATPAARGAPG